MRCTHLRWLWLACGVHLLLLDELLCTQLGSTPLEPYGTKLPLSYLPAGQAAVGHTSAVAEGVPAAAAPALLEALS